MHAKLYAATASFFYRDQLVPAGALAREGHEILEGREHLFRPAEVLFEHEGKAAPKRAAHSSKSNDEE